MEETRDAGGRIAATDVATRLRVSMPWANAAAGGLAFALVLLLATNSGGYWPAAWSWTAFLLAWLSVLVILLGRAGPLSHAEHLLIAGLFALAGWIALSATWSDSVPRTMGEVHRAAAYAAIVVACAVVVRARSYGSLLLGAWAAIVVTCTYALGTRLLPERLGQFDPISGYRLSAPVGYWNALGILAVLGIILALGLAARRRPPTSVLAAASLLVLVPTLYFTFSRGAWLALGVALAVSLALDPRRFQLGVTALALAVCPALAITVAYKYDALTTPTASLAAATREGHRLAILLAVLALVQSAVLLGLRMLESRIEVPARVRKAAAVTVGAVLVLALVGVVARLGGPVEVVERTHREFLVPSPPSDLNDRLFSLSSNGRADLWSVAWRSFEESPWTGSGPGTFETSWLRERTYPLEVRDAHSVFTESLAELGVVGTAVLVLVLAMPLAAAARSRRRRLVPVAAGGYAAFLVHASIDWDWEMLAVTGTGLVCGIALLAASRPAELRPLGSVTAGALAAGMLAVAVFSFAGVVGQSALAAAEKATSEGAPARAQREARRAARWQPWSSEALRIEANAQLSVGRRAEAHSTLSRAVAKDPLNWELWFDLAIVSDGTARTRAARQAERLNPLAPQIVGARAWLGLEAKG